MTVEVNGGSIHAKITASNSGGRSGVPLDLMPMSEDAFLGRNLPGGDATEVIFARDHSGKVISATAFLGGHYVTLAKK
ncbi:MAG: hypothetical protein WA324_26850 [Bryobacteraceae bacterium]